MKHQRVGGEEKNFSATRGNFVLPEPGLSEKKVLSEGKGNAVLMQDPLIMCRCLPKQGVGTDRE